MTIMAQEIASIPDVVAEQIRQTLPLYLEQGEQLARLDPPCLITCARGSSDHATLYFKYLVESQLGVPVCSMGPSIASIYDQGLATKKAVFLAVSQSGGSKDIAALCNKATESGLTTIALVNEKQSLLGSTAKRVLPLQAGKEQAVAATKSFVCSLVALASIYAGWRKDKALIDALTALPDALERSLACDWQSGLEALTAVKGLFVISRGPGYAIAQEAALKFKETCGLHAEAFSAAEVRHGPIALAQSNFAALCFASRDKAGPGIEETVGHLQDAGIQTLQTGFDQVDNATLPVASASHILLDPICHITSFYKAVEQLTVRLGTNPDAPAHLSKVTVTL